jgi:hypothetical protein
MNPQLDHLNGRAVLAVEAHRPNLWTIRFEGDALIRNLDEARDMPEDIEGTVLISSDTSDSSTTVLQFGYSGADGATVSAEIPLTPDQFDVVFPDVTEEEDLAVAVPEDPSTDRVADGPEAQDGQ